MLKELEKFLCRDMIYEILKAGEQKKLILITGKKQGTGKTSVCKILKSNMFNCYEVESAEKNEEQNILIINFDKEGVLSYGNK